MNDNGQSDNQMDNAENGEVNPSSENTPFDKKSKKQRKAVPKKEDKPKGSKAPVKRRKPEKEQPAVDAAQPIEEEMGLDNSTQNSEQATVETSDSFPEEHAPVVPMLWDELDEAKPEAKKEETINTIAKETEIPNSQEEKTKNKKKGARKSKKQADTTAPIIDDINKNKVEIPVVVKEEKRETPTVESENQRVLTSNNISEETTEDQKKSLVAARKIKKQKSTTKKGTVSNKTSKIKKKEDSLPIISIEDSKDETAPGSTTKVVKAVKTIKAIETKTKKVYPKIVLKKDKQGDADAISKGGKTQATPPQVVSPILPDVTSQNPEENKTQKKEKLSPEQIKRAKKLGVIFGVILAIVVFGVLMFPKIKGAVEKMMPYEEEKPLILGDEPLTEKTPPIKKEGARNNQNGDTLEVIAEADLENVDFTSNMISSIKLLPENRGLEASISTPNNNVSIGKTLLPQRENQFCVIETKIDEVSKSEINPKRRYISIIHPDNQNKRIVAETSTKALVEYLDNKTIKPGDSARITLGYLAQKMIEKYKSERVKISQNFSIPVAIEDFYSVEEYQIIKDTSEDKKSDKVPPEQ